MKKLFPITLVFIGTIFLTACSNGSKEESNNQAPGAVINQNSTVVQQDSIILSHDSETVQTVKDVKVEEKNAINQEKLEAEKLKKDEGEK